MRKDDFVPFSVVKDELLSDPEVKALYLEIVKERKVQEILIRAKERSGLTSSQIAAKMGVSQPAVSRLEKNAMKASFNTLEKYASACGVELELSIK